MALRIKKCLLVSEETLRSSVGMTFVEIKKSCRIVTIAIQILLSREPNVSTEDYKVLSRSFPFARYDFRNAVDHQ